MAERKIVLTGKAVKGWSGPLFASATEVVVSAVTFPALHQLSQGNPGCVNLLFVLVFVCANLSVGSDLQG